MYQYKHQIFKQSVKRKPSCSMWIDGRRTDRQIWRR